MATKIIYVGAKPSPSAGADVQSNGPHSPATIDQNFANLQSSVDLVNSDTVDGFHATQTPAANQIPVVRADKTLALPGNVLITSADTTAYSAAAYNGAVARTTYFSGNGAGACNLTRYSAGGNNEAVYGAVQGPGGAVVFVWQGYNGSSYSEWARLDAATGTLLVGATSGTSHTIRKDVASLPALDVSNQSTVGIAVGTSSNGINGYAMINYSSGVGKSYITAAGSFGSATNSYAAYSDIKIKREIETARNYLVDLNRVRVVKYGLISDGEDHHKYLGVIAQELEQIFPGMIEETRDTAERPSGRFEQIEITPAVTDGDETITAAVISDDLDRPIMERYETGEVTKGVKYSVFGPMLITAVQELSAQNTALEARLAALELLVPMLITAVQELSAQNTELSAQNTALEARLAALESLVTS